MKFFKTTFKKASDFAYDHPTIRIVLVYIGMGIAAALSALIFAYGYKTFVAPIAYNTSGNLLPNIVTGGASGVSQIIVKICDLFGLDTNKLIGQTSVGYIIQSSMYVLINIPLFFLAFKKIGKRFTFFSAVNVGLYFVFVNILPNEASSFFYTSTRVNLSDNILVRAILAGLCTGLSSGIAVQTGHSAGGIDVVSVYITGKRTNSSIGRVSMYINAGIITTYTILSFIQDKGPDFIPTAVFSLVYFFATARVLDALVSRNKKMELQIITENADIPQILIGNFPHTATILHGVGAFAHKDKTIINIVLSSGEVKRAIKIIKEADPKAFIIITKVDQIVGRFYIEPHR